MADAAEVLREEGARPDATVEDGGVKAVHRRTGDIDLFALVNRTGEDITTSVSLTGRSGGVPYLLDPWRGEVTPAGTWTATGARATLEVTVEAGSMEIVAMAGRKFTGTFVPTVGAGPPPRPTRRDGHRFVSSSARTTKGPTRRD